MDAQEFENYLMTVDARLGAGSFKVYPARPVGVEADRVYRRRRFSITKFGIVDTFCVIKVVPEGLANSFIESFSRQVFGFALENKIFLPRGFGGTAIAYPVLVTGTVSDDVKTFIKNYSPKHWASFEFPVVVDLSSRKAHTYTATPAWGCAYYKGFRSEAQKLFCPV